MPVTRLNAGHPARGFVAAVGWLPLGLREVRELGLPGSALQDAEARSAELSGCVDTSHDSAENARGSECLGATRGLLDVAGGDNARVLSTLWT